jgi:2-dehydro-3-deoxygluconokinase
MGLYFLEGGADLRALRVVYDRAHSAFSELAPSDFDWTAILSGARWLHLSGISPALGDAPLQCVHHALDAAAAHRIPVSLDLNYRPALWSGRDPRPILQPLAARATLLIANPGAIEVMLGLTTAGTAPEAPEAIRTTAESIHRHYGCTRVAITQREVLSASVHGWQAHLWDAATQAMHFGERYQVQLIDRVGGGDAFVAGLLHQLLADAPLDYAVRFATAASALKLTIPGDINRVRAADVELLLSSAT